MMLMLMLLVLANAVLGQQIFVSVGNEITSRPKFEPTYKQSSFEYTQSTTVRTAVPVPSPTTTTYYAKGYNEVSHLLGPLSSTTWANWDPSSPKATDSEDPYGQAAFNGLWESASLATFKRGIYSTVVEPTPVPSSELVLPPGDPYLWRDDLSFPRDFMIGVAGSAAQIEGAVTDHGRGPSIMEKVTEQMGGDKPSDFVTNENYYLYKQDIARLAAMGVKYYSFSIPWTRILPFAMPGTPVNQEAIDHYDDVIDTVLAYGMIPMVTVNHFDTPLMLMGNMTVNDNDFGVRYYGQANESYVDAYVNYGKIVLTHYADRVPYWLSFSEANRFVGNAQATKNVLLAHAKLYRFYHDELKGCGKFGIKVGNDFPVPLHAEDPEHVKAAQRFQTFQLDFLAKPIFLGEDYPEEWKQAWADTDYDYLLSEQDLALIADSADYFCIDPYTAQVVAPPDEGVDACAANKSHPLWPTCANLTMEDRYGWAVGYRSQSYVYITPTYARSCLNYLWNTFKKPILIGEFGFPEFSENEKELNDQRFDLARSVYVKSYLNAILESIHYDNAHILGTMAWSFADNWEFGDYSQQFGMQVVNRTTQERYYKKSFFDYVDFIRSRLSP